MFFNILAISTITVIIFVLGIIFYKKAISWETYVGYLNPFQAVSQNFIKGDMSKKRKFHYVGGSIDLKKHPEFTRFHVLGGKDVLVRTKPLNDEFKLIEGKTMLAIFEIKEEFDIIYAIPCLRKYEKTFYIDSDNPLPNSKLGYYLVTYEGADKKKTAVRLPKENLIGVIEYESL